MMETTRRRAHTLRGTTVKVVGAKGQQEPLSNAEKARRELNQLFRTIPTRQHILIPRNRSEAHRRPDSLCVLLGLPFRVLGPLLFAAGILVAHKKGGLAVSQGGFQLLLDSYSRQDHHKLTFQEKKPSEKSLQADARSADDPPLARIKYYYIYRGPITPNYIYCPLVANSLLVEGMVNRLIIRVKRFSEMIRPELEPIIAAIFEDRAAISINTIREMGSEEVPSLITPTENLVQIQSPRLPASARSILRSPPVRTPGASPPLQRVRFTDVNESSSPRAFSLPSEEEEKAEVIELEEEKKEDEEDEEEPAPVPPVPPAPERTIEDEIPDFLALDFDLRDYNGLRPARRPTSKPIEVETRRQATAAMRMKIVWVADQLGYHEAALQYEKQRIAEAASRVVFYDCGCPIAPKGRMVRGWFDELDRARRNFDIDFGSALENDQLGSNQGSYCNQIEAAFPGYLHEMYRKAGKDPHVTYRATFAEMAEAMNNKSLNDAQGRPPLQLTRNKLKVWFTANKGKVRKGWERPILTPERMAARVQWCKDRKEELAAAEAAGPNSYHQRYYCFLDEKWFYIRSRCKKLKVLPRGPLEPEGADQIPIERESSRRHATKVMVLGVIADPVEEHGFDGKVYFTRVARNRPLRRSTYSDKIFDDLAANTALHRQWHGYVSQNDNAQQMIDFVAGTVFDLDQEMKERLVIRYKHHKADGTTQWKPFKSFQRNPTIKPKDLPERPLEIRDLVLQARYKKGDEIPEDVSCDSEFMMEHMDSIGRAIRAKYHWVPADDEIFLVMDNAGGHGTHDTIDRYVESLLEDHKVRVIWQEPRGPELNLLDLGAWMSLQSAVEKHFRGNRNDVEVLWRKIQDVWGFYDATVFRKIWKRWQLALDLIIADNGNNRLVNEHRGELHSAAAPLPPPEQDDAPPADDYDGSADDDEGNEQ